MKNVLITGSSNGIGYQLINEFNEKNYYTIGVDIVKNDNCDFNIICDLNDVENSINHIKEQLQDISYLDCLINNAAVQIPSEFDQINYSDFKETLNVNVLAPFFIIQSLKELFYNSLIINITSIHQQQSKKDFLMYATSKGALHTLTQNLALDLENYAKVISISPGAIDTEMLRNGLTEEGYENLKNYHINNEIGNPEDLASFIEFINKNNNFLNGTNVEWDGGISKKLSDPEN